MAEILLYGIIGDTFDKLDAATVTSAIRASSGPLSVRINSAGGYVMEGLAIIQALRDYPHKVTIHVDGLAASMASAIAMVGTETIMAESALMMVHKPWDSSIGNADDLRRDAEKLDRVEQQLIGIYAKRTGLPEGELAAMLAAETWMTPAEALALGFVTSIAAPLKIAACAVRNSYGFRHTPAQLKEPAMPIEITDTTQAAVATERTRISTIMALGTKHDVPTAITQDLISRGLPLDQARAAILDHLAAEGDRLNIGHTSGAGNLTLDNPGTYNDAVRDALVAKIGGVAATGPATQFQGMSVVDIARDVLARGGTRDVHRINADRVINIAMTAGGGRTHDRGGGGLRAAITHTTWDFPDLVGGAAEKYLVDRYKLQQSPLKQLARRRDYSDFLTHYGVQVDDWGALDRLKEAGEYRNRSLSTRANGYKIDTYGNMFNVSRQMLVNDGMQALADILNIMAGGAAETEATILAALIASNVPYPADNVPFFHASHNNLAATAGLPSIATLDAGRMAMRGQKNSEGRIIDAAPKFLLTPVTLQTAAETLVASTIAPATTADVNPFANKLTPIADPRLSSSTAWFLFADPTLSPAMQYSYLDGQDGWRVDGTEYKVRHDFGAG